MLKNTLRKFILITLIFSLAPLSWASAQSVNLNADVESRVRSYFADIPVMIDIAKCETGFRQFAGNGDVLRDPTGTYLGIFQFDEQLHFMNAWSLMLNIYTVEGNMGYARHLYNARGTAPWKGCVPAGGQTASAPQTILGTSLEKSGSGLTVNLRMGQTNAQVKLLQQKLNALGYVVATSGPGSPGNETPYFGQLTREAVRKFQCAKINVCIGSEATTGYGRIGPATRSALNTL